ncbi:hypothetical protein ABLE92_01665 [Gordonia sp. VNQ95]|uniref:hypothetical protein n=1 Tax=Gordonia sp. VNQ95 TaxID=3156619 RepID=UPI0032B4ADDE
MSQEHVPEVSESRGMFASLRIHNYRLYFGGQALSLAEGCHSCRRGGDEVPPCYPGATRRR